MISWLRGRVLHIDGSEITVNTGNIGYNVYLGTTQLLKLGVKKNEEVELVIYTLVREDEIRLYGFESFFARSIFLLLLGVSGVGPKAAINIVDKLDPHLIISAIQSGDHSPFQSVSGIGKKTAQRIILDLQGKIDESLLMQSNPGKLKEFQSNEEGANQYNLIEDAISALSNLGFSEREADKITRKHLSPGVSLDDIIRKALVDLQQ
jgi:holliday junction DNA helicase RuvA